MPRLDFVGESRCAEVLTLFRQIVESQHVTLLMVLPDPLVDEYADQVLLLKDGQIVKA